MFQPSHSYRVLADIESLFHREPEPGAQFLPFSAVEYEACVSFLCGYPSFTLLAPDQIPGGISTLVEFPPHFKEEFLEADLDNFHRKFASEANEMSKAVLSKVFDNIESTNLSNPTKYVVPVWRAGLSFVHDGLDAERCRVWHIGAARDPETLRCKIYHSGELEGECNFFNSHLIIADPYIGTGWTILKLIEELEERLGCSIPVDKLHLACFAITPEGAARIVEHRPGISITSVHVDSHLNEKGWVVSNNPNEFFGDFGDFFSPYGLNPERLVELQMRSLLDPFSHLVLRQRLGYSE